MGFWKLLLGTVVMLAFGYMGETAVLNPFLGFAVGMCGWFFILFEIFAGEAGGLVSECSPAVATAFNNMRLIVTLGWAIYNIADFVNKDRFVLSCCACAKEDSPQWAALG